jgi:hypothetical protein
MAAGRRAFVHEVELLLDADADERAPGGAVTVALCGRWDHVGPCRWPHNSAIDVDGARARVRTVFVAPAEDEELVRERIDRGIRAEVDWTVVGSKPRPLAPDEEALARRLASSAG